MNLNINKIIETNPKILIVDDKKSIHDEFRKILSAGSETASPSDELGKVKNHLSSYDVDAAVSGKSAQKKVVAANNTGSPFSVCFVNIQLLSGWDSVKTIKNIREVDKDIQVVVCSTYPDDSREQLFYELGETDNLAFLRKPFDKLELLQLVNTLTCKWRCNITTRKSIEKLQKAFKDRTTELEKVLADLEVRKAAELAAKKEREAAFQQLERSHQQLQELVTTDALTGLSNRRSFDEKLDEYAHLSERMKQPLSCIMTDIDHFKRFNDNYGHQTGDEVLRQISQTLESNIRKTDLIARYGGEEFVLLLPNTTQKRAFDVAEKLRQAIEDTNVLSAGITHQVTVSMGVYGKQVAASEMLELVDNADKALYRSKHEGRNRVSCYEEE